jgi:hypothetical protein
MEQIGIEACKCDTLHQQGLVSLVCLPERQFRFKDCLSLQTSTLTYKQVVEISLKLHYVHIEYLISQMQ